MQGKAQTVELSQGWQRGWRKQTHMSDATLLLNNANSSQKNLQPEERIVLSSVLSNSPPSTELFQSVTLIVVVIGFPSSRRATNALKSGELFSSLRSSKLGWMECVRQKRWIQIAHHFPPLSSQTVFTNICCSCYWCWCCRYQQSYRRSPSSCWLSTIPSWLSDTLCILHKQKHSVYNSVHFVV